MTPFCAFVSIFVFVIRSAKLGACIGGNSCWYIGPGHNSRAVPVLCSETKTFILNFAKTMRDETRLEETTQSPQLVDVVRLQTRQDKTRQHKTRQFYQFMLLGFSHSENNYFI